MRLTAGIKTKMAVMLMALSPACMHAQQQPAQGSDKSNVKIIVHEQTDQNGNVISYDTTYIYVGKGASEAYVDSVMQDYGATMNGFYITMPLNTPDFSEYLFIQQMNTVDFDKMEQINQKQMDDMMQSFGAPPCNGFFCQPPATPRCCPKDTCTTKSTTPGKKCPAKQNKSKGGVQI